MIELSSRRYTLADVVRFLEQGNYGLVRHSTKEKLDALTAIDPAFNEPTHQKARVYLTEDDKNTNKPMYLVFSNLGYLYFSDNDILEHFYLDKTEFFFDFNVEEDGVEKKIQTADITLTKTGHTHWSASFDFEHIFHHFGLDGEDDFAPFVGIYK